jgi:hypothetical protein
MTRDEFMTLREGDELTFWPYGEGEGESYPVQVLPIYFGHSKRQFLCRYIGKIPENVVCTKFDPAFVSVASASAFGLTGKFCGQFFENNGPEFLSKVPLIEDMVMEEGTYEL